MPFKSEAQRRFLYAKHPEIAERWSAEEKREEEPRRKKRRLRRKRDDDLFRAKEEVHKALRGYEYEPVSKGYTPNVREFQYLPENIRDLVAPQLAWQNVRYGLVPPAQAQRNKRLSQREQAMLASVMAAALMRDMQRGRRQQRRP